MAKCKYLKEYKGKIQKWNEIWQSGKDHGYYETIKEAQGSECILHNEWVVKDSVYLCQNCPNHDREEDEKMSLFKEEDIKDHQSVNNCPYCKEEACATIFTMNDDSKFLVADCMPNTYKSIKEEEHD